MTRATPFSRGWEAFDDGLPFGNRHMPEHYGRRARLQFLKGWKAAKRASKESL